MIRLMRRLFWVTAAGGLALGGWSFWKLRGKNDELPQGNWSPIPSSASGAQKGTEAGSATTKQGFASSTASASKATATAKGDGAANQRSDASPKTGSDAKAGSTAKSDPAAATSSTSSASTSSASTAAKSPANKSAAAAASTSTPSAGGSPSDKTALSDKTPPSSRTSSAAKSTSGAGGAQKWVAPDDNGSCPADFAIKANDGSKIYHVPTGRSYKRTKAERCYATAEDAAADGYRAAKA